ncbi:pre-rRNA-processing protein TSR1 homolog [Ischnura elegans]|uniref:pre-rRNA-processing protein TSR1 homolog n=1 Tax=Ischnura elegans TaxID=197161 RepID=UPI001ED897B6|nr:pre-rRNA-processing protein TSR1 homolog [Ischnura elegans]
MGTDSAQERHRPGEFKQPNKAHKHGRHRSKGAIDNAAKGKVSVKALTARARRELKRNERRNQAHQLRAQKRAEAFNRKRSLGSASSPPFLVALVPLSNIVDVQSVKKSILNAEGSANQTWSSEGVAHLCMPRFKQRFSFVTPPGDLFGILDTLKSADTVILIVDGTGCGPPVDEDGEILLSCVFAQGLPTPVVVASGLSYVPQKKRGEVRQNLSKDISRWFPEEKVLSIETPGDALLLLRRIGSQKQRPVTQRDRRPHLFAEKLRFLSDSNEDTESLGTLLLSGYVRGKRPLSVNSLVHIPGWGTYQMAKITAPSQDPHPLDAGKEERKKDSGDAVMEEGVIDDVSGEKVLQVADPEKLESLQSENEIDPMEGEQTWPTAEELAEAAQAAADRKRLKRVPKGTSAYQAAWIPDSDNEGECSDGKESGGDDEDDDGMEEEGAPDLVEAMSQEDSDAENGSGDEEEYETITVTEGGVDPEKYDMDLDLDEEECALKKIKEAKSEIMFPDEVDSVHNARVRFQKYRGLKSYRTSPWDPKENLPQDYAKIFQFQNFDQTRRRLGKQIKTWEDMEEDVEDGIQPGMYVTLHVIGVPMRFWKLRESLPTPLTVHSLLPHEQKMSLLNLVLRRPPSCKQDPIRSKEPLFFQCGVRRFRASPIYSQHTNGSKHKFERFFQPDATVVASMFAPITFPPASVLAFTEAKDGHKELVAVGSVLDANPDRIVVKRTVLSGHPFKVHRRSAVIRFMFFDPEDINWFKPIELRTKYGRRGHIKEPLGTHGHMKCVFDGQLKSQDTVLMNLYKRVFPKWTYDPEVSISTDLKTFEESPVPVSFQPKRVEMD